MSVAILSYFNNTSRLFWSDNGLVTVCNHACIENVLVAIASTEYLISVNRCKHNISVVLITPLRAPILMIL